MGALESVLAPIVEQAIQILGGAALTKVQTLVNTAPSSTSSSTSSSSLSSSSELGGDQLSDLVNKTKVLAATAASNLYKKQFGQAPSNVPQSFSIGYTVAEGGLDFSKLQTNVSQILKNVGYSELYDNVYNTVQMNFTDTSGWQGLYGSQSDGIAELCWALYTAVAPGENGQEFAVVGIVVDNSITPPTRLFELQASVFSKQLDFLGTAAKEKKKSVTESSFTWSAAVAVQEGVYDAFEKKLGAINVSGLSVADWESILPKEQKDGKELNGSNFPLVSLLKAATPLLEKFSPLSLAFVSIISIGAYKGYGFTYTKQGQNVSFTFGPQKPKQISVTEAEEPKKSSKKDPKKY